MQYGIVPLSVMPGLIECYIPIQKHISSFSSAPVLSLGFLSFFTLYHLPYETLSPAAFLLPPVLSYSIQQFIYPPLSITTFPSPLPHFLLLSPTAGVWQ